MRSLWRIIWTCRILALLLLAYLLTKPELIRPATGRHQKINILLDASPSMRVQDPVHRLKAGVEVCHILLRKFPESALYTFADDVQKISDKKQLDQIQVRGQSSNLAGAIQKMGEENPTAWGVVISDGRQIGSGDPVSAAALLQRPLLLVGVGDKSLFKDLAVRKVQAPPFAFKNYPVSLSATVSATGFSGKKIRVQLREGEKTLASQDVDIRGDDFETEVAFVHTPSMLGSKNWIVDIAAQPGEVSTQNNRKEINMEVGRDRFRVLYISGHPGPEYGFLRHQFKSDPGVELVTFVILRNNSNIVNVPDSELSLIPFPTEDVFIQQMSSFDLIVFDEFSYRRFGLSPSLLDAIKKRVEQGGSFLLVGGVQTFGPQSDFQIPVVSDMFPVQIPSTGLSVVNSLSSFVPKIPEHPIFKIEKNEKDNRDLWKNIVKLDDMLWGLKPKEGSVVLANMVSSSGESPVLVAWKWKQGRVAVSGVRTTFRWSMQDDHPDRQGIVYSQFWKNMVLWLTHSSEDKLVRLGLDEKRWTLNKPNTIRIWVYDSYFKPLSDVDVQLLMTYQDGSAESLNCSAEVDGVYSTIVTATKLGSVKLVARVQRQGKLYGTDVLSVRIQPDQSEEEDFRPQFNTLMEMAKVTQGQFVTAADFNEQILAEFEQQSQISMGEKIRLWNSPWMLLTLLILVFSEWGLRRFLGQL